MVGVMQGRDAKRFTSGNTINTGGAQSAGNLIVRLLGDASGYQKMLVRASKDLKAFGRAMSTYVSAPIALMGGFAVREFAKFDQAMTESFSIMEVTENQREAMRKQALLLAREGIKAPEEIARSYYYLASAGLNAEQAMKTLPVLEKFATAGAFDMAKATELLMDSQAALGLKVADANQNMINAARIADVLTQANIVANAEVEQFAIALTSKAGSAMKVFNIQVEEGVAVLAAMADQGIKAELAGNNFARILFLLSKASMDNQAAFRKFKFSIYNAEGGLRPLADIVQNLTDVLEPLSAIEKSAALEALGFEARIQGAIMPLIGTADAIRKYYDELNRAKGVTQEIADEQMKSFANQMKNVWNQIKALAIGIGEQLAPKLKSLADTIEGLVQKWDHLNPSTKASVVEAGLFLATLGPLILTMAAAAKGASYLATVIAAIGTGSTAAVAGVVALGAVLAYELIVAMDEFVAKTKEVEAGLTRLQGRHKKLMQEIDVAHKEEFDKIMGNTNEIEQFIDIQEAMDRSRKRYRELRKEMSAWNKEAQAAHPGIFGTEGEHNRVKQAEEGARRAKEKLDQELEYYRQLEGIQAQQEKQKEEDTKAKEGLELSRINEMKTAVEDYTKELQKQYDTLGMKSERQIKLYELEQQGASEAMLEQARRLDEVITQEEKRLEMVEKGKELMEQYLDPLAARQKREEDLCRLLAVGAINQKTYDRAMKASHKDYLQQMREKARLEGQAQLNYKYMNNRAVRENTDEFYAMMQQVPGKSAINRGDAAAAAREAVAPSTADRDGGKTAEESRDYLKKIYEDNHRRSEIILVPANLGGEA